MIAYLLWIITTIVAAASSSASISDEIVTITSGVYGHWTYETYNDCKKSTAIRSGWANTLNKCSSSDGVTGTRYSSCSSNGNYTKEECTSADCSSGCVDVYVHIPISCDYPYAYEYFCSEDQEIYKEKTDLTLLKQWTNGYDKTCSTDDVAYWQILLDNNCCDTNYCLQQEAYTFMNTTCLHCHD